MPDVGGRLARWRRAAWVLLVCLGACDDTMLDEGTAESLLSAHLSATTGPQTVVTRLGAQVPLGQSSQHTAAWWSDFESLTNGQDRTKMLYLDGQGPVEPAAIAGLREARLAVVHGQIRDPVQANTWWTVYTPVTELRPKMEKKGQNWQIELCTLTEALDGVTGVSQESADHARVAYTTRTEIAHAEHFGALVVVQEASSCQGAGSVRSRTINFVRLDEAWQVDVPKPSKATKKR